MIHACKECIDRGGVEGGKFIHLYQDEEKYNKDLICGVVEGRALSVRNRVIIDHRQDSFFAAVEHIDTTQFKSDVKDLLKSTLNSEVTAMKYVAALPEQYEVEDDDISEIVLYTNEEGGISDIESSYGSGDLNLN